MEIFSSLPSTFTPLQSSWIPSSSTRFVSVGAFQDGKGAISIRELDQDLSCATVKTTEYAHGFRCASFGVEPRSMAYLATGQYDGSVKLWDLEHLKTPVWSGNHSSLVNGIHCTSPSRPEFISCSRDGSIHVWDTRLPNEPVLKIISENSPTDCWVAKYDPKHPESIFGGYKNGDLCAFDLRKEGMYWKHRLSSGICDIDIGVHNTSENTRTLLATTTKGKYFLFALKDVGGSNSCAIPLTASLSSNTNGKSTIWRGMFCPKKEEDHFMTTSNDGWLRFFRLIKRDIWEPMQTEEISQLRISDCGVLSFEWHPEKDDLFLLSCLDNTISIGACLGE